MQTCGKLERSRGPYFPNIGELKRWLNYVQLYEEKGQAYFTSNVFDGEHWKDYFTGQFCTQ